MKDDRAEENGGVSKWPPWPWPMVLWMSGLDGQGLGPNGLDGLVARLGTVAIFWPFRHT